MIQARSIGQRAAKLISLDPTEGQVLACFERAWNLVTTTEQVCTLAWVDIPDGPSNIILSDVPGASLPAGTRFVISGPRLHFIDVAGGRRLPIDLSCARIWAPGTDWHMLRARRSQVLARIPGLTSWLVREAPLGSLAHLIGLPAGVLAPISSASTAIWAGGATTRHLPAAALATDAILRAWGAGNLTALTESVTTLCGLGPGLTPAGDDWLAGWLLALRLEPRQAGDHASTLDTACSAITAAATRTTRLSQALLACAAAGEVDAYWQALLDALVGGPATSITAAASRILAQGATSGADMLAGFLMSLQVERNSTWSC